MWVWLWWGCCRLAAAQHVCMARVAAALNSMPCAERTRPAAGEGGAAREGAGGGGGAGAGAAPEQGHLPGVSWAGWFWWAVCAVLSSKAWQAVALPSLGAGGWNEGIHHE